MKVLLWGLLVCFLLAPLVSDAQGQGYGWYAPNPYFGGGFWGASTAAESYQRGFADVVRSAGQANVMNSIAAQNYEAARTQDIENRVKWTESYYQMRQANREYRASKRSPRLSEEEIVRISRQGLPNRLTSADLDPLTGQLNWPIILRADSYAPERQELDKLFLQRATSSSVSPEFYASVQKYTSELLAALNKNINVNKYRANDWVAAKKFIESLAYETRFPAG